MRTPRPRRASADTVSRAILKAAAKTAEQVRETDESSVNNVTKLEVTLFFSFDIVGSTDLKRKDLKGKWVDVIRYFYYLCETKIQEEGLDGALVWKLIGDETVFCRTITDPSQIQSSVSAIFKATRNIGSELSIAFADESSSPINVKSVAWLAPIRVDVPPGTISRDKSARFAEIAKDASADDVRITVDRKSDPASFDFLGPNIDAGFRLAHFAKSNQLVLSPGLAYYMLSREQNVDRMFLIGYKSLKGVAESSLYPGIWYHQNFKEIEKDFNYRERRGDDVVARACGSAPHPISEVKEVRTSLAPGYFFEADVIDEIIELNASDLVPTSS